MSVRLVFAFALGVALVPGCCMGQNLVPNGSFEEYTECPDYWAGIDGVTGWNICGNSPDYFNACRDSIDFGIPLNAVADQYPSHGNAYCGVVTAFPGSPNLREFLCASLESPLQIGVPVFVSFKVSPGGFSNYAMGSVPRFATRGVGLRFMSVPVSLPNTAFDNEPAVYLDAVLQDTSAWTIVSEMYIPDSAYSFVAFGNFFDDDHSGPIVLDPSGTFPASYAVVDEVCVTTDPVGCDFGMSVPTALPGSLWVQSNPFSSQLVVRFAEPTSVGMTLLLYDSMGRQSASGTVPLGAERVDLDTGSLAAGVFTLVTQASSGSFKSIRLAHVSP